MPRMFHVSSVRNRESIRTHGLDWARMSAAPGIAGSSRPEVEGVFLSPDHFTAQFFVRMNNTGGPVDVWAVEDVDPADLIELGSGFSYLPHRIDPHRLTLQKQDLTENFRRLYRSTKAAAPTVLTAPTRPSPWTTEPCSTTTQPMRFSTRTVNDPGGTRRPIR